MKSLWIIVIVGILLRIFLSFATFHSDTQAFGLAGKVVAAGHILNLYDYSSNLAVFNYPPLIYWFHGLFRLLLPFSNYGFVKLPYLLFDSLIILVLFKLFPLKSEAKLAVILWLFNPINLYATYMMGQFDIIPTFFTLLSIYLISKNKLNLAALTLGGGIAFKLYPLFLVIPLILLGRKLSSKIKLATYAFLPYIISILPYFPSGSFRSQALLASQTDKSLYAAISVSGGESILLFPASLLLFYLFIYTKSPSPSTFWKIYLVPLLLFFTFTHYHPQWLIWITPFIIISLVSERLKNLLPILLILGSWLASLFFFDPSLTLGMFAPLWPSLHDANSIWSIFNLNPNYNFLRSILQTISAASFLYLIYNYFPKNND